MSCVADKSHATDIRLDRLELFFLVHISCKFSTYQNMFKIKGLDLNRISVYVMHSIFIESSVSLLGKICKVLFELDVKELH
jgi:hypothetical protein